MVNAFKAGTPKHVLAKRYDMKLRSLKKLLREEGVKRKSRGRMSSSNSIDTDGPTA
jgi:hypothetical protein